MLTGLGTDTRPNPPKRMGFIKVNDYLDCCSFCGTPLDWCDCDKGEEAREQLEKATEIICNMHGFRERVVSVEHGGHGIMDSIVARLTQEKQRRVVPSEDRYGSGRRT